MTAFISTCRWLLLLLAAAIPFGLAAAQEATPPPEPPPDCAECHLDVVANWQTSLHAQAYYNETFQSTWQAQGEKSECLACHTTGYSPRTRAYQHEGVTCSACHGQTPMNHPPEAVAVDPGVGVCADCHERTFSEWEASLHGEQQLACTSCHTPHNQGLRFETSNALCLNCHEDARDDYAHVSHPEQNCVDCHWHQSLDETQHILTGDLMPTGHDSQVETRTCLDCHADLPENAELVSAIENQQPLLSAQVRIDELETEVETARAQGENQAAVNVIQGVLVGALVMSAASFGVRRLRR